MSEIEARDVIAALQKCDPRAKVKIDLSDIPNGFSDDRYDIGKITVDGCNQNIVVIKVI